MAQREIRYISVPWQVTRLPDGSKEVAFADPDGITAHVLVLKKDMAQAMAAQLADSGIQVANAGQLPPKPKEPQ